MQQLSTDNYYILHNEINFEDAERKESKKMNELFKLNIRLQIKKVHAKEFHFTKNNLFAYK